MLTIKKSFKIDPIPMNKTIKEKKVRNIHGFVIAFMIICIINFIISLINIMMKKRLLNNTPNLNSKKKGQIGSLIKYSFYIANIMFFIAMFLFLKIILSNL